MFKSVFFVFCSSFSFLLLFFLVVVVGFPIIYSGCFFFSGLYYICVVIFLRHVKK